MAKKRKKKSKLKKIRDWIAVNAWFRSSAGAFDGKKYNRKTKHKKDYLDD